MFCYPISSDTVILRVEFPLSDLEWFSDPRLILDSHVWVDEINQPGAENHTPRDRSMLWGTEIGEAWYPVSPFDPIACFKTCLRPGSRVYICRVIWIGVINISCLTGNRRY